MSTSVYLKEINVERNNEVYKIGEFDYTVVNVITSQPGLYPKILPSASTLEVIGQVGNQQGSYPTETLLISTLVEQPPKADGTISTPQDANRLVGEEGFVRMWRNNWREFLPILPGLVIIFASSHHTVWAINKWLNFEYWMPQYVFIGVIIWFAGAIIGSVLGASLVSYANKRYLYVS